MDEEYESLREAFDDFFSAMAPHLTGNTVDKAVNSVNTLVGLLRPRDWSSQDKPRIILGITSDWEKVVYGENAKLGFYHARLYKDVHERVLGMVEKAREDCAKGGLEGLGKDANAAFIREINKRLVYAQQLLEDLVDLKPEEKV